ncbi:1552_t:CDS:1, partial [Dentiscutata heterogama]
IPTSLLGLLLTKPNNNKGKSDAEKDTTVCEFILSPSPDMVEASTSKTTTMDSSTTELSDKEQLTLVNGAAVSDSLLEMDLLEESADKDKTLISMMEEECQNIPMPVDAITNDDLEGFTPVTHKKKKKLKITTAEANRPSPYQKKPTSKKH